MSTYVLPSIFIFQQQVHWIWIGKLGYGIVCSKEQRKWLELRKGASELQRWLKHFQQCFKWMRFCMNWGITPSDWTAADGITSSATSRLSRLIPTACCPTGFKSAWLNTSCGATPICSSGHATDVESTLWEEWYVFLRNQYTGQEKMVLVIPQ